MLCCLGPSLAGAPGGNGPSLVMADALDQAGWRPADPQRALFRLAELPISLQQPRDLLPLARSPLLGDNNPYESLKHSFLAARLPVRSTCNILSVRTGLHLALLRPNNPCIVPMRTVISYQELQTCLQRALVAVPPGTDAAP